MRRVALIIYFTVGICAARVVFATDASSTNFNNNDSTFVPAAFSAQSTNFKINGSVEYAVDPLESAGFAVQSGVPLPLPAGTTPTPTPTPAPTPGGGGGLPASVDYVIPPTLLYRTPTFLSHQNIQGTRGSKDTVISVNGSSDGVTYPTDQTWERDMPLFLGRNAIVVRGRIPSGYVTPEIGGEIERLLIGDVNRDHTVNDRDLSLFVRAWKTYTPYADFNEDGKINDIDLSLLVSHWGMKY